MFKVIGLMLAGICIGFLIRKKRITPIHNIITVLIWVLLFILGIEVGSNQEIINGLTTLGMEALVITLGAILGSCIAAWGLWYFLYKKKKGSEA